MNYIEYFKGELMALDVSLQEINDLLYKDVNERNALIRSFEREIDLNEFSLGLFFSESGVVKYMNFFYGDSYIEIESACAAMSRLGFILKLLLQKNEISDLEKKLILFLSSELAKGLLHSFEVDSHIRSESSIDDDLRLAITAFAINGRALLLNQLAKLVDEFGIVDMPKNTKELFNTINSFDNRKGDYSPIHVHSHRDLLYFMKSCVIVQDMKLKRKKRRMFDYEDFPENETTFGLSGIHRYVFLFVQFARQAKGSYFIHYKGSTMGFAEDCVYDLFPQIEV